MDLDFGAVPAEHLLHRVGNFADGGFGARRVDRQRQQIAVAFAGAAGQRRERRIDILLAALVPQPLQLVDLQPPHRGILHLQHVDRRFVRPACTC